MSLNDIDTVKDLLIDEQIRNGRLQARVDRLRSERNDTLKLYETVEAWVTTLDNGEIMDEPPWYRNLIIEIAFLKGEYRGCKR